MSATVPPGQQAICEPGPAPEPQPLAPSRPGSNGQQAILFDWFGTDPVNYEPVTIPASVGQAVASGLLCVRGFAEVRQNASDGAESDGGLETAEDTDCHHLAEYTVNGDCLRCDLARHGREDADLKRELTEDTQLGDTR